MNVIDTVIPAKDGYALAATVYGDLKASSKVVIISSATAVPRAFYRHYAGAMLTAGYNAVTYDYRGIGGSKPRSLRGFPARMRDWGLLDMAGVVDWVTGTCQCDEVYLVGHSAGGQLAGLLEDSRSVKAMIGVSAQSGYWKLQGGEQKLVVAFHVHLTLPLLTKVLGYTPWSWFSSAEDLPGGVATEWSGWCRDSRYLLGDDTLPLARYGNFKAPVLAYSIADDKWGTAASVDAMTSAYPVAERRHIDPRDHGLSGLGHFGYFRRRASKLWSNDIAWFDTCHT